MAEYPLMKYWEAPDGTVYEVCDETARNKTGGVDEEQLTEAVNAALTAAKESGEFDGADGKDGYTPVKGVDYFDGKDGKNGYTPVKGVDYFDGQDGADGSPGKDGADGKDGYTPIKGVDYFDGNDGKDGAPGEPGVSPTTSVSKADGVTTVTFSGADGVKTATINDGKDGKDGSDANVTAENITAALGYTPADAENTVPNPATATAGQGIAVEAVDGSGKPTSWKAVDLSRVKNVIRQDQFVGGSLAPTLVVEYLDGTQKMIGLDNINTDTILYPELSEDGVMSWDFINASDGMIPRIPDMPLATQEMLSELSAEKAKQMVYYTDRSIAVSGDGVTVDDALYVHYDALQSAYPDYISKNALGKDSAENTIYEYVFTTGNYNSKDGQREQDEVIEKPVILLVSGVHGYEKGAAFSTFQMLRDMTNGAKALSPLREGATFKVVPVAVPCSFNNNARVNANGVNINRNFDFNWEFGGSGTNNYSGASAADQPETQVLQSWLNNNKNAYLCIDFHNSGYSNEVSMITGSSDYDKVNRIKKQYLCGIDALIPYLQKNRGFIAEDVIFSYTGTATIPGILHNYAQSCGITSASLECASNQNNTGMGSAESVAVGAEVLGNMFLEIYSNVDNTQSVDEIVDLVLSSLINAEGVSY